MRQTVTQAVSQKKEPPAALGPHAEREDYNRARPKSLLLESLGHALDDALLVGERSGLLLRVDQLVPDRHLEAPAAGRDEREGFDLLLELGEQFGRQTDGLRFVPSNRAVLEFDVHNTPRNG